MPITHTIDGNEETFYSVEEVEQINQAKALLEAENAELKTVNKEKTENFRKLNTMTEEERSQFTAKELENRQMLEKLQEENENLKSNLTQKQQSEIDNARNDIIKKYTGDNEELKNKFLEQYQFVNIPETDSNSIAKRAEMTARLAGIEIPSTYDFTQADWSGDAPRAIKGDTQAFLASDRAQNALNQMGGVAE